MTPPAETSQAICGTCEFPIERHTHRTGAEYWIHTRAAWTKMLREREAKDLPEHEVRPLGFDGAV